MKQAHLMISGRVQGVGYRYFVKSNARRLGLTGWVQNLPNGRVEAVVQGDKRRIEILIHECHKGPMFSEVEDVEVGWEETEERFADFSIRKLS